MKNTILTVIVTALVVGLGVYYAQKPDIQVADDTEINDWIPYETREGFTFSYPPGYAVQENTDPENPEITNYFVVGLADGETLRQGPPVLQINASPTMVSLALWEGIPWEGYPKIAETFKWE